MKVKDGATKELPDTQIIIAVPNEWLQLPIADMLSLQKEKFIRAKTLSELYEKVGSLRHFPSIVVIDLLSFADSHVDIIANLKNKNPSISLIVLVSSDELPYMHYVDCSTSSYIVVKEEIDSQLTEAIERAKKDQLLISEISLSVKQQKQLPTSNKKEVSYVMNENKTVLQKKFGRRSFLKGSAAAAVTAGVAISSTEKTVMKALAANNNTESAIGKEEIFAGVCRGNCSGGCFLNVHVRDGKVVKTSARDLPNPEYNRICVRGLTHMHRMYHPERLKYPMKRVGERGSGQWERISWDEAISTIAEKWTGYQKEFGKNAFAINWGSGSYATCSGQGGGSATNRLLNVTGSSHIAITVDAAIGRVGGIATGWGPNFSLNECADFENAKTFICWGANPVVSQVNNMHFILKAKEKGTKYIVIDPIYNANASKADMYVPIRAGTDGMLALAMMNIVVRENWQDKGFLKAHTVAPFLVKKSDGKYLRLSDIKNSFGEDAIVVRDGQGNIGIPSEISDPILEGSYTINGHEVTTAYSLLLERIAQYPPEKAAKVCNIPIETIEELTRTYATEKPSTIYQFFGVDHYVNGHYGCFDIYVLAMLTGNMCKMGASCGMGEMLGSNITNYVGTLFPPGAQGPGPSMVMTEVGNVLDSKKYGELDINLKGIYVTHSNLLTNMIERKYVLDWLKRIEFVVVADMNMNETAQYADILLPVAHWFEQTDAFCAYHTHPHVLWQDKAVDPPFECKSDFQIIKLLAEKMGYGEFFNMTEEEYISLWLDSDGAKSLGIDMEKLKAKKALRSLPGDIFISYEGGNFLTPTGRAQFYQETVVPDYDIGQEWHMEKECLPYWEPPNEAWYENPLYEKYPFHIISEHVRFRTHSQWWDVPVLLEIDSEPTAKINPIDANRYGIKTGDKVKLFNDRGYVVMTAHLNEGIQPGIVLAPKGWEKKQFIDGHYNDLGSRYLNPVCANQAFFDVLVAIEKV